MENGLGKNPALVDLSIPCLLGTDQALKLVKFLRVTVVFLNTDISLQNYMSG